MANHRKQTASGTNIEEVKKQNQKAAQGNQQHQHSTEFASETDVQKVKKANKKSQQKKK